MRGIRQDGENAGRDSLRPCLQPFFDALICCSGVIPAAHFKYAYQHLSPLNGTDFMISCMQSVVDGPYGIRGKGGAPMSGRRFGILTVLLVLIILFCMKGTAMSMGKTRLAGEDDHYQALEREYVTAAREYLKGQGFDDCGIMLTRMTGEGGRREYTVRIHHRRLQRMSPEEKSILESILSQEEFGQEVCTFNYDL